MMFQSLIGRLETSRDAVPVAGVLEFQSLIGRLETEYLRAELGYLNEFQSLIGRLETRPLSLFKMGTVSFNPS